MTFVARTSGDARQAINLVRARVQEIDAQQPIYSLDTMDATIARSVAERRFSLAMMGVFAGLTLVLATLGVYGMLAQRVASRSREIGVRLALGAVPRQVFRLVLREGTSLVIIGLVLGGVVVVLGAPLIESSLFGVTAADGTTFIGSITALTLAALLASLIPALSAARTDPVRTLRSD
jgi:ABC-type antimicrobial peptide transport system permease subunit